MLKKYGNAKIVLALILVPLIIIVLQRAGEENAEAEKSEASEEEYQEEVTNDQQKTLAANDRTCWSLYDPDGMYSECVDPWMRIEGKMCCDVPSIALSTSSDPPQVPDYPVTSPQGNVPRYVVWCEKGPQGSSVCMGWHEDCCLNKDEQACWNGYHCEHGTGPGKASGNKNDVQ